MISIKSMRILIYFSLFILFSSNLIHSSGELKKTSPEVEDKFAIPSWGMKKARTGRYEVQNVEVEYNQATVNSNIQNKCQICRPNCPHWNSLNKKERNRESYKWFMKNLPKDKKSEYKEKRNTHKRERYSKLPKEQKEKLIEKINDSRRRKIENMTIEEKKEYHQIDTQRRKAKLNKMNVEERHEWRKRRSEITLNSRRNKLASMTIAEKRKWYKKNRNYSSKTLEEPPESPK